jgi:hypothetical protein
MAKSTLGPNEGASDKSDLPDPDVSIGDPRQTETADITSSPADRLAVEGVTADDFADQDYLEIGGGPFVKFIAVDRYTHKLLDVGDLRLARLPVPEGLVQVEWNPTNGYLVPTSVFGEGGKDNVIVRRLIADPAKEFEFVESAQAQP